MSSDSQSVVTPLAPTDAQRAATRVRPTDRAPVMFQSWRHLLFLHWKWSPADIQNTLPPGLFVDTFNGDAYLGVVPFWMDQIRPRFLPPAPGLSWFLELNLRTYVHTADGTPGVWFYSLDCNQPIAVQLARTFFSLPYVHARQSATRPSALNNYTAEFKSQRPPIRPRSSGATSSASDPPLNSLNSLNQFRYAAAVGSTPAPAIAGSLEYFLAERYVLFSRSARTGRLSRGQVWHMPYQLSPANVTQADTTLFPDNGFIAPARPADHAMVSAGVDVSIFNLQRLPA